MKDPSELDTIQTHELKSVNTHTSSFTDGAPPSQLYVKIWLEMDNICEMPIWTKITKPLLWSSAVKVTELSLYTWEYFETHVFCFEHFIIIIQ